jgi:hypothetical protein
MAPSDAGVTRSVDRSPFLGIPAAMADKHTLEGKRLGTYGTVLSGFYEQHAAIARRVAAEGWGPLREEVHAGDILYPPRPELTFDVDDLAL